jgi:hypothetical protein
MKMKDKSTNDEKMYDINSLPSMFEKWAYVGA